MELYNLAPLNVRANIELLFAFAKLLLQKNEGFFNRSMQVADYMELTMLIRVSMTFLRRNFNKVLHQIIGPLNLTINQADISKMFLKR